MYLLVALLLIPLISSRSISNETSIDELDPLPSNDTSIDSNSTLISDSDLIASLQRVTSDEYEAWKPWLEEKEHEMAEWRDSVQQWKEEHTSVVLYITIGMFVGLFLLIIVLIVRCLATRLRRRKIGQLGGDALGRKKLMSDDMEEM